MDRSPAPTVFGSQLKHWRQLRRKSQLELSIATGVSPRHISFIETGRSRPGADVIERLAEALDVPLRERNDLLRSAGLPARYPQTDLSDAALEPFRRVITMMLEAHDPFPGFVLDRWWTMVDANRAGRALFVGGRDLAQAPVNMLDWMLSPEVRAMIVNWHEMLWTGIHRMRRELEECGGDARLRELHDRAMGIVTGAKPPSSEVLESPVACARIRLGGEELAVVSTIARFGRTREVTLQELRVELIFPADDRTRAFFMDRTP